MPKTLVAVVGTQRRILTCLFALVALATPAFAQATASTEAPSGPQLGPVLLAGEEPNYVEVGAGAFALIGHHELNQTAGADAEFKFGDKFLYIAPALGVIGDLYGGGMGYAALYTDLDMGSIVVTPMGGVGADWHGNTHDERLGGTFEFRLSLEVAYQFANETRLGLRTGHISNAGINRVNPGENDLMLTYSIPLSW